MGTILSPAKKAQFYSYPEYKNLVESLAQNSATTGEQLAERIAATKINAQRILRIDKQCMLNADLAEEIKKFTLNCLWLVIAESWCGDGAQIIPVLSKITASSSTIELKIILRDENPEIMDNCLTNGARSIPKLVCINKTTGRAVATWGPRPKIIQEMVLAFKQNNPHATHDEFVRNLHLWYAKDKTKAIQDEFTQLLPLWNKLNS